MKFELGHNEIGDADEPEHQLAADLAALFTEVGLDAPKPMPVMRVDYQVAQKLHAVSDEGSERGETSSTSDCSIRAKIWVMVTHNHN